MKLTNKAAIITGAARGIGRAIAETFGRNGADLILADILPQVNDTAGEIQKMHDNISVYAFNTDIRDLTGINRLVEYSISKVKRIDILVNNAGICRRTMLVDLTEQEFLAQFDVNVKGTFFISKAIARHMIELDIPGRIINTASVMAKIGEAGFSVYTATKHAILGLSRCLAFEMAPYHICVNSICPGIVDTDMERNIDQEKAREENKDVGSIKKQYEAMIPLGRYGQPMDIANTALFLASPESDYITGQAINVCGGMVMY